MDGWDASAEGEESRDEQMTLIADGDWSESDGSEVWSYDGEDEDYEGLVERAFG